MGLPVRSAASRPLKRGREENPFPGARPSGTIKKMKTPLMTACTMDCPDACSLIVEEDRKDGLRIRGNPDHPYTLGFTCAKIKRHPARLAHPGRILTPRLRTRGGWSSISWDDALDLCAEKIEELRGEPAALLHLPSDGAKGVLKRGVGLFFARLGSSRVRGSLCDAAGYIAHVHDFGSRENHEPDDLLRARRIVNWGRDLSRSSVHLAALVRQARRGGTRVLTISPGGDGNGPFSDAFIRVRPGKDRFLAAAVVRELLDQGMPPPSAMKRVKDWPSFEKTIRSRTVRDLAARCGVSLEDVRELLTWYAAEGPCATLVGTGLQRYSYGGENVRFINALAFVSGNMGRPGGGSYFHLHSFANLNLHWARTPHAPPRRSLILPRIGEEILRADRPSIRMIWVNGSNIVNQAPNIERTIQALKTIPFKVVVDAFMTDTAERADLVLPSTLMLEQEDIVGSYWHRNVQWAAAALPPPGEARDDYAIVADLGRRLSPPIHLPSKKEAFRASLDSPFLQTSLEEIRRTGWAPALRPPIPYEGLRFDHSDGLYHPPGVLHEDPEPPPEHPLRLLTLIRRNAIHSQILPEEQEEPPTVRVSPETLLALPEGARKAAFLTSPIGRMKVFVRPLEGLHPEAVLYRRGDWKKRGGGANRIIRDGVTDLGNGAPFYDQYVRLDPIEET